MQTPSQPSHKKPWKDGEVREWPKCPYCGYTEPFSQAATKGEGMLKARPDGVLMPLMAVMPYETALVHKGIQIIFDVCFRCGAVRARYARKGVVATQMPIAQPGLISRE